VQLDLLPFGEQALRHFLFLERPEGIERQDAAGFVPAAPPREPVQPGEALPRGRGSLARTRLGPAARTNRAARAALRRGRRHPGRPHAVTKARQRAVTIAAAVADHVPADLRPRPAGAGLGAGTRQ